MSDETRALRIKDPSNLSKIFTILSISIVIFGLYAAQEVLVPLALAVLIAFLLAPVVRMLERRNIPRGPSVIAVVLLTFGVLTLIGWIMFHEMQSLAGHFTEYQTNVKTKVDAFTSHLRFLSRIEALGHQAASQPIENLTRVEVVQPPTSPLVLLRDTAGHALGTLATAGIVLIFVIFMLIEREDVRDRVIRLVGRGRITVTTQAMDDAGDRVSRYLLMQSIINGTFGVCVAIGLWIIGIPQPALWGLLGAMCRFVPYVGPVLAAVMPFLLSMAVSQANSWLMTAYVLGLFIVLELSISQFLEPILYGSSTGISALAILVAAVFWTWLWGPVGLLLSTPLTVCLVVMGKYVPQLEFLDIMLGSEPVLEPPARLYQRLVAGDYEEASDLIDEFLATKTPAQLYDDMILPALAMTEEAFKNDRLEESQRQGIVEMVSKLIEDVPERRQAILKKGDKGDKQTPKTDANEDGQTVETLAHGATGVAPQQKVRVLCLPAHDAADDSASAILSQVLRLEGYDAKYVKVEALAAEMMDQIAAEKPDIVFIAAVPPDAVIYTRYLCKRLAQRFDGLHIIAGLFGAKSDPEKLATRLRSDRVEKTVTTVATAIEAIWQIAHTLIVARTVSTPSTPATTETTPVGAKAT